MKGKLIHTNPFIWDHFKRKCKNVELKREKGEYNQPVELA